MYILTYNGFTLENDSNHTINTLEGISRLEVRKSEDYLTGGDGGNIWERKLGMRIITVGGWLGADDTTTYFGLRSAMQLAFPITNTATELIITNSAGVSKAINAKVVEIPDYKEGPGENNEADYNLVLKCENPYFRDTTAQTFTASPATGGGTPVPMPVASPIGLTGGSMTIVNTGDIAATALYTITGAITNPSVTNMTTGESFTINSTLGTTDSLQVYQNSNGFFCILNGTTNYYQYFSGVFPSIAVGTNDIVFTGAGSAVLTVTYYNYYLGY